MFADEAIETLSTIEKLVTMHGQNKMSTAIDFAIEALERQKPVRTKITGCTYSKWLACCNCESPVDISDKYCRNCGSQLDWSE